MLPEERWLLDEKYAGVETEAFEADKARLSAGEPLAYVIGYVPFLNTTIHLDSRPLIPRTETEFWVEQAIKRMRGVAKPRVLDLCAGSGAIGVAVAKAIPDAHISFAEIDAAHIPTIEKNLEINDIPRSRYKVFQSDLFRNVSGTFDFILSNPPYIDPALDRTESGVKDFEPHLALYGGRNGIKLIQRIIEEAPVHLSEGGELWLEHEPEQTERIQELACARELVAETHKDQYGIGRFTVLM